MGASGRDRLIEDICNEIMLKRSNPGILIFDLQCHLLYFNQETGVLFPEILKLKPGKGNPALPPEILSLCSQFKKAQAPGKLIFTLIRKQTPPLLSASAYLIRNAQDFAPPGQVIVIIQQVTENHVDFEKVKKKFKLSSREVEVFKLICHGFAN